METLEPLPLDLYFAKTVLEKGGLKSSEKENSLAALFHYFREGHLCAHLDDFEPLKDLPETVLGNGGELFPKTPLVRSENRIYLQKNWVYETLIVREIKRVQESSLTPLFNESLFDAALQEEVGNQKLLPEQGEALKKAFKSPFFVLTGGPGTGKTYTASMFIKLLSKSLLPNEKLFVTLTAPTGKAASHLEAGILKLGPLPSVQVESTTLHRLVKLQPGENRLFSKRGIDADLIIVDEASMVDLLLLAHLLEAVRNGSRLILMGDPDQLPPVENLSLFTDLSTALGSSLTRCMRTDKGLLMDLAQAVRVSDGEKLLNLLREEDSEIERTNWPFDQSLAQRLYERISPIQGDQRPEAEEALVHYGSMKVLNALRQGPFGTDLLNRQIFEIVERNGAPWRAFPILILANDPRLGLYNGMTGVLIVEKGKPLKEGLAYFPDRKEPLTTLPPFEVSFCLSIHKSQGSEFGEVLAIFPKGSENFGRESLYTAITRAKRKFSFVGDDEILCRMASHPTQRISGISSRL